MKYIADFFICIGFLWIGFWMPVSDKEMYGQLKRAMDDGFRKYDE